MCGTIPWNPITLKISVKSTVKKFFSIVIKRWFDIKMLIFFVKTVIVVFTIFPHFVLGRNRETPLQIVKNYVKLMANLLFQGEVFCRQFYVNLMKFPALALLNCNDWRQCGENFLRVWIFHQFDEFSREMSPFWV